MHPTTTFLLLVLTISLSTLVNITTSFIIQSPLRPAFLLPATTTHLRASSSRQSDSPPPPQAKETSSPPLLVARGLSFSHDGSTYQFKNIDVTIPRNSRIGLIGKNGEGKSTLLSLLKRGDFDLRGAQGTTGGLCEIGKNVRISFVEQSPPQWGNDGSSGDSNDIMTVNEGIFYSPMGNQQMDIVRGYVRALRKNTEDPTSATRLNDLAEAGDKMDVMHWELLARGEQIADTLFLTSILHRLLPSLSGGERKRACLASSFIESPDLIILDEPTNHLDVDGIQFLTKLILTEKISAFFVTHDRAFLDSISTEILELDRGKLHKYSNDGFLGGYANFLEKKAERVALENKEDQESRGKLKKEMEWMRRQPQARQTKQKARQNSFYNLQDEVNAQDKSKDNMMLDTNTKRLGAEIMSLKNVTYKVNNITFLSDFSYTFSKGDRIGIVGKNGVGKTTLLRLLNGENVLTSGMITKGDTVKIAYYDQRPLIIEDKGMQVLDFVVKYVESNGEGFTAQEEARKLLKKFNFPSALWQDRVSMLSGGQQRRLQFLLQVMAKQPNMLILDEITNDLDLDTLSHIEDYLMNFEGVIIIVSHDRYFVDKCTEHLFVMEGEGKIKNYVGSLTEYISLMEEEEEEGRIKDKAVSELAKKAQQLAKKGGKKKKGRVVVLM